MTSARLVGLLAAVAALVAVLDHRVAAAFGVLAIGAVAVVVVHRRDRLRGSSRGTRLVRWRQGWWLFGVALVVATVATLSGPVVSLPRTALFGAASALLFLGVVGVVRTRDPARGRDHAAEAGLAGLVAAYVASTLVANVPAVALELLTLAAQTGALWALVQARRREPDLVTAADRLGLGVLLLLVAASIVGLAAPVLPETTAAVAVSALVAAAFVAWGGALTAPDLWEAAPGSTVSPEEILHVGQFTLVLVAVVVGPAVTGLHLLRAGVDVFVIPLLIGGVLALAAFVHLTQLVRDHGNRAMRARYDPLTGLPSEPLFEDRLEQAMASARRTGGGLAVAFIDLDGFKRVNDRDGHVAGDEVLRRVALRLRGALREEDTVARKSGDEFLVLLPGVDSPADAEGVAAKLLGSLRSPVDVAGQRYRVGASIGLALWPRDGATGEELIRHADAAMYEVKETHGGAMRWYTTTTTARTRLRYTLAQQLDMALSTSDEIQLAYQPRVDLRDSRVVGLVALVRWRHPDLGLLTPRSFLPIAAEAGLTEALDVHILERACSDAELLHADHLLEVPITVHLSDRHVASPRLPDDVKRALRRTGLAPDRLVLALTENGLERGGSPALGRLAELSAEGVEVMLARFGTGAVAISTLAELRRATVELASTHVASPAGRPTPVVEAALALAERFGLGVTANGVVNDLQVEVLRALGCTTARGPYLGPPLLAERLASCLAGLVRDQDAALDGVRAAGLLVSREAVHPERPELAAVLAAALEVDSDVEEDAISTVLTLLGRRAKGVLVDGTTAEWTELESTGA